MMSVQFFIITKMDVKKFAIFLCLCHFIGANESTSIINKTVKLPRLGSLKGSIGRTAWTNRSFYQFRGVQYAESPSGKLRFKAPVPVKPWQGVRDASNFGQNCPFIDDLLKMTEQKRKNVDLENCLNMAIYTPNLSGSLPVMVYVHGGGFYFGGADVFPPNYFLERDIVLVVVQYRLDALGFLSTKSVEIPGNVGLKDVLLALNFIQENIEYFGGNPNSVTLSGQSSGAAMVSALSISPAVPKNLFHRAIIQSGSIFSKWSVTTDPVKDARDIAEVAGLNSSQSITSLNKAFMKMSVFDLLQAVDSYQKETPFRLGARSISIGGPSKLLPNFPRKIVSSARYKKAIPMIIGTTKDDGTFPATVGYDVLEKYMQFLGPMKPKSIIGIILDLVCSLLEVGDKCEKIKTILTSTFWTPKELASDEIAEIVAGMIDLIGTFIFKAPALELAVSNAKLNNTFLYTFDYEGEKTRFGFGKNTSHYPFKGGVTHCDDLLYLFPYPLEVANLNEADTKMAQKILDLWTSFAANGVPKTGSDKKFTWLPVVSGKMGPYAFIDKVLKMGNHFPRELLRNTSEKRKIDYSQLLTVLFN